MTAAAGGVGIAAIQLANLLGARAVAACGSAEKLALCERYGASAPGVNYAAAAGDGRAFRAALQEEQQASLRLARERQARVHVPLLPLPLLVLSLFLMVVAAGSMGESRTSHYQRVERYWDGR